MTDRAVIFETTQIGVETTSGTNVAANRRLQNTIIRPSIATETQEFTPNGFKYETVVVNGKEWTAAEIEGVGSYTDPVYMLSGMFGAATISTPGGGTNSRDWLWNPDSDGPDTQKTFSVEYGSSVRAEELSYGLMTGLGIEFTRSGIAISGELLGQLTSDGISLTGSPTDIASVPIIPDEIDIYHASSGAGLSSPTQLNRVFRANWQVRNKAEVFWPLNSSNTSFGGHAESKPEATLDLLTGADATSMALLTDLRAGATRFFRIKCTGSIIEGSIPYLLQIDVAAKHRAPGQKTPTEGLTTIPWNLRIVHDSTWGKAMSIKMTNMLTAL